MCICLVLHITNKTANMIETNTKTDTQRIVKWSESVKAEEFSV